VRSASLRTNPQPELAAAQRGTIFGVRLRRLTVYDVFWQSHSFETPDEIVRLFLVASRSCRLHADRMKRLLPVLIMSLLVSVTAAPPREFREVTNLEGKKIKVELLDLTPEGVLKVNFNLKPFQIPLDQLTLEDQAWLKNWDAEKKLGKEAAYYNRVLFTDDFSAPDFGPRWSHYKSGSVIKDGVLVGITPDPTVHAAVDNIRIDGERDLEVSVKFQFTSDKAKRFDVWFDDAGYKGSHAGHICQVSVSPTNVVISDAKEGGMKNEFYDKRSAPGGLDETTKALLETKIVRIPAKVSLNEWHTLVVRTRDDEAIVNLDGKKVGSFKSGGIAHETKSLVSLTTNDVDIQYDDFSVKAGGPAPAKVK